ncbi:MAG: transglutaminaseTgpA domain-containing protein [Chloroflexota bacterium]
MKLQFREGWSSLLLLLGMLLAVAWSLEAAQWTDGIALVQWAVIIGLLWGVAGAKSILPGWFMHIAAAVVGIFWTVFLAGALLPNKLSWYEKVVELRDRYWGWFGKAMVGNTNTDNLVFLMECLLVLFFISYAAAWFAYRRHSTWQVILPAGVVLVVNIYNAQGNHSAFLFMYLICALLFAVRVHLTAQEHVWQRARMGYNRLVGFDFLRDGAIFSVIVILFAQALPAAAANAQVSEVVQGLGGPWQGVREKWGLLFASLNYKPEPSGQGFFGSALTLGGALHLNNTPMMEARMPQARYWEAVTYDKYNGKGWENTDTVSLSLRGTDSRLSNVSFNAREVVTQTIKVFYPTSQLFGAPMPVAWSRPIVAQLNRDPNIAVGDAGDKVPPVLISMAYSGVPTRANDEYTVLSLVPKADIKSLRKAPTTYPEWVTDRYLQLPPNIPPRVKLLAERVVKQVNAENNFDKAAALEEFLRAFTYNEFIQPPPADRDVVDYFLFTSKQGYCNYYASSMSVMLRLLGIPARVVSGYARGEYDSENDVYRIRESDSHTWVEAFFPTYGWIQFEPTASQPLLERIEGTDQSDDPSSDSSSSESSGRVPSGRNKDEMIDELEGQGGGSGSVFDIPTLAGPLAGIGYFGIFALLAGVVALATVGISWQRHVASLTPLEAEYEGMQRYARWLGLMPRAAHTPHEFAAYLAGRIPQAAAQIRRLADLYVRSLFARDGLSAEDQREAKGLWPQLRKNFAVYFVNQTLTNLFRAPERLDPRTKRKK